MGKGPTREYHMPMNDAYVEGTLTCLKQSVVSDRISPDGPLVMNIEPTNACNLRCTVCPREKTARLKGVHYMAFDLYRQIIDEIAANGQLIMLNLHKDGEPLLHKKLPEMVAYAKETKVARTIHLNTNGTLLDTETGRGILEAGIDDVTISVDAACPETYHRIKRSRGYAKLVESIETFIDYRNHIKAQTFIRVKIMEFDQVPAAEIEAFYDKWQGVADQVQVTGVHNWSGAIADLAVTDEIKSKRYPCGLLWYALAVNSNGAVSICNVDWDYSGVVGHVRNGGIRKLWNDSDIKAIRKAHLDSVWQAVPVCADCVVWASLADMTDLFKSRLEFLPDDTN